MQALILAAGLGSRLAPVSEGMPKVLVTVAGRPLIDYALRFARRAGARRLIVVGGFGFDGVRRAVLDREQGAQIVENPAFRKANLFSFLKGATSLDPGVGTLLMNSDHVYRPSIADFVHHLATRAAEVTAFCDCDRLLTDDDMKVCLDADHRVLDMAKTLASWQAGYVGMTFVPASRLEAHLAAARAAAAEFGDAAYVEQVLVRLARTVRAPRVADISGHGWLEVDVPAEREHAEQTLLREGWWG